LGTKVNNVVGVEEEVKEAKKKRRINKRSRRRGKEDK
jgi:hypothetical protein